jgi:hypothetical protein
MNQPTSENEVGKRAAALADVALAAIQAVEPSTTMQFAGANFLLCAMVAKVYGLPTAERLVQFLSKLANESTATHGQA